MDDVASLRRTVHRCTAFLVATVAVTGVSIQWGMDGDLLVVIAAAAIVYLVADSIEITPAADRSDDGSEGS